MAFFRHCVWLLWLVATPVLHAGDIATPSPEKAYRSYSIRGWQIYYESSLLTQTPQKLVKAFAILDDKLEQIEALVPSPATKKLRQVPIWLSVDQGTGLVYHASRSWLVRHGRNPAMSHGVELQNVDDFILWIESQPMVLLHELAHSLHHRVFDYQQASISAAFKHAKEQNLYSAVKRYDGSLVKAYALEDEREYFAELSEAYFGRNDYYPFNKQELQRYDPIGYAMVDTLWHSDFTEPTQWVDESITPKASESAPAATREP